MEELLSVIEQRNQIICSLDQDVQRFGRGGLTAARGSVSNLKKKTAAICLSLFTLIRERKEDKLLKATLNSKGEQSNRDSLICSKSCVTVGTSPQTSRKRDSRS